MVYINNREIKPEKKYNIFDSKLDKEIKRNYNIAKSKLKEIDRKAIINVLDGMKPVYNDFPKLKQSIKSIKTIEHPYGGLNVSPDIKDNKMVMEVNKKFFKNQILVKENYERDVKNKFHPQNSTYKHMGIHELGHCATFEIIKKKYSNTNLMINDWNQSLTSKEIVQKAFNNLGINDKITQDILRKNISIYSKRNYSENIAEAFVDYYANKNSASVLSKEIIKVMKGMI